MPTPIPTIGRRLYYWPTQGELSDATQAHRNAALFNHIDADSPFDAGVVFVHSPTSVNLVVTDHFGKSLIRLQVPLIQDGPRAEGGFCEWMPYQVANA